MHGEVPVKGPPRRADAVRGEFTALADAKISQRRTLARPVNATATRISPPFRGGFSQGTVTTSALQVGPSRRR